MGRANPDGCQFGITLKYEQGKWSTTEQYKYNTMSHQNHQIYEPLSQEIEEKASEVIVFKPKIDAGLATYGYLQNYRKLIC
jgi:hypothetical protein